MPLILVIDSNIWLGEQMLRHSAGSALRFFLRTNGARVALPEVVRREVVLNLGRTLKELSQGMQESHERMLRLVGSLKELVLPTEQDLEAVAFEAFESARIDIFDVPFSLESAQASFDKCLRREPPSGLKDQQFKDGVLWADCVRLAADNPVLLVTADKGFYRERTYAKGLATNLNDEARVTAHGISVVHELSAVLEKVRTNVSIDYARLSDRFLAKIRDGVDRMIGREGFAVGDLTSGEHKLFATDNPAEAHLEFRLSYRCVHPDDRVGTLIARGEATYCPATDEVADLQARGEEFHYSDVDGQRKSTNAIIAVGSIVLGHRTVHHDIRVPLSE